MPSARGTCQLSRCAGRVASGREKAGGSQQARLSAPGPGLWPVPPALAPALIHFSVGTCGSLCPARTSQSPGKARWQRKTGALLIWEFALHSWSSLTWGQRARGGSLWWGQGQCLCGWPCPWESRWFSWPHACSHPFPPLEPACKAGAQLLGPPQSWAQGRAG